MNNLRILLICLTALLCCQTNIIAKSKSDKLHPQWVTRAVPESHSGTYIFVRAHGEGASFAGARQMAFVNMAQKLEQERGLTVNTSVLSKEKFTQTQSYTNSSYQQEITMEVTENGHRLEIVCREIDDYWEEVDGKYSVDILYTVTDKNAYGGSYDDQIKVTTSYGAAGFLSIVPSVAQFYKGSVVKGSLILAGEVAAAGGILLCENTRSLYVKKMHEQPKYAAEYNSLADTWETGRNICIGAAAAIYVYNLIDAFTAKGARRVVVKRGRTSLQAAPYIEQRSFGMGLTYKF